jgi:dUTP pyrophosphatase
MKHVEFILTNTTDKQFYPSRATTGAAGYDVRANIRDPIKLCPGDQQIISLGFKMWIRDPNVAAIILPRSGLGSKGIVPGNLVGLIDSDYQGEVKYTLWNRAQYDTIIVNPGDRIGQMVFIPVLHPYHLHVHHFEDETERGEGGLGSTGVM